MTKEELSEKRGRAIKSLNDVGAILGLDEMYIDELEKENAELKKEYSDNLSLKDEELMCLETEFNTYKSEAKELIENIIRVTWGEGWNYSLDWKVKAEQFLNSVVEK